MLYLVKKYKNKLFFITAGIVIALNAFTQSLIIPADKFNLCNTTQNPFELVFEPTIPISNIASPDISLNLYCYEEDGGFIEYTPTVIQPLEDINGNGTRIRVNYDVNSLLGSSDLDGLFFCSFNYDNAVNGDTFSSNFNIYAKIDDGIGSVVTPNDTTIATYSANVDYAGISLDKISTIFINNLTTGILVNAGQHGTGGGGDGEGKNKSDETKAVNFQSGISYTNLQIGINNIELYAQDCYGNIGPIASVTVNYTLPEQPLPVSNVTINSGASGNDVNLTWYDYDPSSVTPKVNEYKFWKSNSPFTSVSDAGVVFVDSVYPYYLNYQTENNFQITDLSHGETIYVGIKASNHPNGTESDLVVVSTTTVDTQAPADTTELIIKPVLDYIRAEWSASPDFPDDVSGYKIFIDNVEVTSVASNVNTYDLIGYDNTVNHTIKVQVFDAQNNTSAGIEVVGYTVPPNPSNVILTPIHRGVILDWDLVHATTTYPATGYYIYRSFHSFSNITESGVSRIRTINDLFETTLTDNYRTIGNTEYYAVITKNSNWRKVEEVVSHAITFVDLEAPNNPTSLSQNNNSTSTIDVQWVFPTGYPNDFNGSKLTLESSALPANGNSPFTPVIIDVDNTASNYQFTGLAPCRSYDLTIKSIDTANNISSGTQLRVYTQCNPVMGLIANPNTLDSINLVWLPTMLNWTDNNPFYSIYMSNSSFTDITSMTPIATSINTTNYTVTGLTSGNTYYFAVTSGINIGANDTTLENPSVTPVSITVTALPKPPVVSTLVGNTLSSGRSILFEWLDYDPTIVSPNVFAYRFWKSSSPFSSINDAGVSFVGIKNVATIDYQTDNFYQLDGLIASETVYFGIKAQNHDDTDESDLTVISVTTVDSLAPDDITGLVIMPDNSSSDILLNWNASASFPDDVNGYKIYVNGSLITTQVANTNNYVLTGYDNTINHTIKVSAIDGSGNESVGVEVFGYTYPLNPINVQLSPIHAGVIVSWDAALDTNQASVTGYQIYSSTTAFTNINDAGVSLLTTITSLNFSLNNYTVGDTLFVAIVTTNSLNNTISVVDSYSYTFTDLQAPDDVTGLAVMPDVGSGNILINWNASASFPADVDGYKIYVNGTLVFTTVANSTSYTLVGYDNTIDHTIKLSVIDAAGNESIGVEVLGYTYPFNPTNIQFAGFHAGATISWDAAVATNQSSVTGYYIYSSATAFTNINDSGVSQIVTTSGVSRNLNNYPVGDTVYFAIATRNSLNFVIPEIISYPYTFTDLQAPGNPNTVIADSNSVNSITISWTAPTTVPSDISGYQILIESNDWSNGTEPFTATNYDVDSNTFIYNITGLGSCRLYNIKVKSKDNANNISSGKGVIVSTQCDQISNLQLTPHVESIDLIWDALPVGWTSYQPRYWLYMSQTPFVDISSMTAIESNITTTSFTVSGLTGGQTYYFAVTAHSQVAGSSVLSSENPTVVSESSIALLNNQPPTINYVRYNGMDLIDGAVLTQSGNITVNASDDISVGRVEFHSSSNVLSIVDGNGGNNYSATWNLEDEIDGSITLTIDAYDTVNNQVTESRNISINLAAPPVPTITSPTQNSTTSELTTTVIGTSNNAHTIELKLNGISLTPITPNQDGVFQQILNLQDGLNTIQARALNNRNVASSYSSIRNITVDQSVPIAPVALSAQARADGVIRLTWNPDTEGTTQGYNVYRSSLSFNDIASATKLNTHVVTASNFDDLAIPDAQYYYRIVGVSAANITGSPSNQASAISDSIPPKASIFYTPQGEYDAVNNIYGAGRVDIQMTLTEDLLTTPYLSMSPVGGVPIAVTLNQVSSTEYTGFFELGNQKIEGIAYAVFSAYDQSNNRGTEVLTGASIQIDTKGPELTSLTISPTAPMSYVAGDIITVEFDLNTDTAVTPQLFYKLSKPGRIQTEITGLTEISTRKWQATFTLPNDVGVTEAETLSFAYSALDNLNNIGDVITLDNQFQIYQGSLPPLDAPIGLNAEGLPAGLIKLTWINVVDAAEYEILRRHESESSLVAIGRTVGNVLEYTDTPPNDGNYVYAVASVRQVNAQEALSGPSNTVTKYSDSVPPNAPTNMVLALQGNGILATWDASLQQFPGDEFIQYNLYRSNNDPINDVSALTPVFEHLAQNGAIDNQPSTTEHAYVATATDRAGNESTPSNTYYLNFELLPVNNMVIDLYPNQPPVISWSHTSNNISEYNVFVEDNGNNLQLNQSPVMATSFTDTTYTGAQTVYSVIAIDNQAQQSLSHALRLPTITTSLVENQTLKRGLMNELNFTVDNFESREFNNISLTVTINGVDYDSDSYTLSSQGTLEVSVVIPGDSTFTDTLSTVVATHYQPTTGDSANMYSNEVINVEDGGLVLSLTTDNFLKGTNGQVQLLVQNPGEKSVDIITARNTNESDEVHFRLEDVDGNILSDINMKQVLGTNVITLPSGVTVARIEPGDSYLSTAQDIAIPANASNHLTVVATIDKVYHKYGDALQRQLQGVSTRQDITIAETSYRGELTSISPALVVGEGQVTIQGQAVSRIDNIPVANVSLKIILRIDGFEQSIDVFTDENGGFSYIYTPTTTDAGIYNVSIVHPDILDRPIEGTFEVAKLNVSPQTSDIKLPFNVARTQTVFVKAPRTLEFSNVTLGYDSSDQPGGSFLSGLQITNMSVISNLKNQDSWQQLTFDIEANNSTPVSGTVILRVLTSETTGLVPATFRINYELSTAAPNLISEPQFIETGVNQGNTITESITLSNQGFSDAVNVDLSLLLDAGGGNLSSAPTWASIVSENHLASLSVGEENEIAMSFNPPTLLADGNYLFYLRVNAANTTRIDIPVQVTVTHSGVGSIQFKAADVYTATLDEFNQPIPGLSGARIKLISEVVVGQEFIGVTDTNGDYLFDNIPVGKYIYRASKGNHNDLNGRITIKPSTTEYEYAFLTQDFINIEWSVTETTITDRYEVVMNLTFETNVPAAVVVIKPVNTNLPDMYPGDVYSGVLEIKNEGLVRADDFSLQMPANDEYFTYELLGTVPNTLNAKQTLFIPYRVINHQSLVPGVSGKAGGGGCSGYGSQITGYYHYNCAEGTLVGSASPAFFSYSAGNSCPVGGGESNPQNGCNGRANCGGFTPACNGRPNCLGFGESTECSPDCEGEDCCENEGGGGPGNPPGGPPSGSPGGYPGGSPGGSPGGPPGGIT